MGQEITFGFIVGKTLTYVAYQPDGTERTASAPLNETEVGVSGYYTATDANIQAGDFVIVKEGTLVVGQGQYKPDINPTPITNMFLPDVMLNFNGISDYATASFDPVYNPAASSFSLCAWVKPSSLTSGTIMSQYNSSGVYGWIMALNDGKFTLHTSGFSGEADIESDQVAVQNEFQFVVFSYDVTGNCTAYVNGNPSGTAVDVSGVGSLTTVIDFYIGVQYRENLLDYINYYSGRIDNIRIYMKALSQGEVVAIYNSGIGKGYDNADAGAASVAYDLNEGYGTTITDEVTATTATLSSNLMWEISVPKNDIATKEIVPYVDRPNPTNVFGEL